MTKHCLSVFDHFVGLALKGLRTFYKKLILCNNYPNVPIHTFVLVRCGILFAGVFFPQTQKQLCLSLFFNEIPGLGQRCFPLNFAKFLRTPCF